MTGDIYTGRTAPFNYYSCGSKPENYSMLIRAAKSGNGYFKGRVSQTHTKAVKRRDNTGIRGFFAGSAFDFKQLGA